MAWWMYLLIGLAAVIFLITIFEIAHNKRRKKKLKAKIAKVKEEQKPEKPKEDDGIIYDEQPYNSEPRLTRVNTENSQFEPNEIDSYAQNYNYDPDYDVPDEDFDEKYQDYLNKNQSRPLTEEEQFKKFRNEHCYSKYETDPQLAKTISEMPKELRAVLFSDIFKKIDIQDFDNKF